MTQDEILKLAIKHGIIPMRFIVDTYEAKKSSILAFANAIQSHSGVEAVATLNSSYGSDTGWQYLIDLRHDLQTDEYLESIHGHDIALYLAPIEQSARIKELENNIKQLDVEFDQRDEIRIKQITELQATNAKLVEQVRVMREALEAISGTLLTVFSNKTQRAHIEKYAREALATVKGE